MCARDHAYEYDHKCEHDHEYDHEYEYEPKPEHDLLLATEHPVLSITAVMAGTNANTNVVAALLYTLYSNELYVMMLTQDSRMRNTQSRNTQT